MVKSERPDLGKLAFPSFSDKLERGGDELSQCCVGDAPILTFGPQVQGLLPRDRPVGDGRVVTMTGALRV
ncbi:hypothetical protein CEP54_003917 [Fusarium duplospermum]|uniref:Uncharacterized protein n=1 Tax=Fusarium duplospermum TaxID=1325734 RepID=A0A428QLC1_9HYPO|nr:hypothetical protein CEP54_003917 [Fusarium duplospermum]